MSDTIVKVIKIETAGGQQTVKGLREEIKSLRDDLLNVDKGTKEYDDVLKKLIDDEKQLTDVMRAGKDEVSAATGSYNALQNEMTSLRKVWKEVTDESERAAIGTRIKEINDQLKEMDSTLGNHQRSVGDYENAIRKVTGEYVTQKQELKALKVELEQLEPGTDAYNEKFMRAAEITHNLQEQQTMLKYSSTDLGDQLSNLRGIAANMAAGFSAANAAIGLFGGESKEVQQAMLKVQQAMALVQGLQGLDGFIKRTTGLSNAMKKWFTSTKEVTVATNTLSTAEKANAAATNAQTVATEGATVAQKGLNAAMKANPIGLILGLLALLVANWKKVTEWLGKAVGGWDKVTKAMNKFKAAAAGVANVIKKVLLVPIKETINYFATLGKVIGDVFTGNWKNIGEDIKNGVTNAVDIVKDGYNVAANYAAGKEAEITRQTNEEIRKRAQARSKELEDAIELKEAQNDADWKYTEEGKAMYEEYFGYLEQLYKNDAEKYHDYQVQKASYNKGLADYNKKVEDDAKKKAEDARKKAEEAAKKEKERLLKIEQDYRTKVEKYSIGSYKDAVKEYQEAIDAMIEYYKDKVDPRNLESLAGNFKKVYGDFKDEMVAFFKSLDDEDMYHFGLPLYKFYTDNYKATINDFKQFLQLTNQEMKDSINDILAEEEHVVFYTKKLEYESLRMYSLNRNIIDDAIENSGKEAKRQINNQILQIFEKNIRPKVSDEIAKLQNDIDAKTIKLDFEIETGFNGDEWINNEELIPLENFDKKTAELERATEVYHNALSQLLVQRKYYAETADFAERMGYTNSDEYEQAILKIEELDNQLNQVHADYFRQNAEIRDRYFAQDIQVLQEQSDTELREYTKMYNELYTKGGEYYNYRVTQAGLLPEHDIIAAQKSYEIQRDGLQRQLEAYQTYLQDVTVMGDQRVEAEKMVAELIAEIEEGEVAHTIEMNELRANAWNEYYSMVNEGVQGIGSIIGSLTDYYEADIKARLEANEITQDAAEKEFETVKGWRVAEAVINTIAGSIGAYLQATAAYPPPAGEIIGAISAAAVAAAGWAQVANIKRQKLGSSSTSQSPAATPQMSSYTPEIIENPTQNNEMENLRNSFYSQPIKAYVVESDITDAQKVANTRKMESSF